MIKNAFVTIVVAAAVAILAPRDLREAAFLTVRAGISLIQLGLALYPPGHDAGPVVPNDEDDRGPGTQHAALAAFATSLFRRVMPTPAEYYPNTPMPQGRGCWVTHCKPLFDGYRHGRRCYWRCPRRPPPSYQYRVPGQPQRYYSEPIAPRVSASINDIPTLLLGMLALIACVMVAAVLSHFSTVNAARETDEALNDAAAAAAAKSKLDEATREAEALIKRQAKHAFRRGRHS